MPSWIHAALSFFPLAVNGLTPPLTLTLGFVASVGQWELSRCHASQGLIKCLILFHSSWTWCPIYFCSFFPPLTVSVRIISPDTASVSIDILSSVVSSLHFYFTVVLFLLILVLIYDFSLRQHSPFAHACCLPSSAIFFNISTMVIFKSLSHSSNT